MFKIPNMDVPDFIKQSDVFKCYSGKQIYCAYVCHVCVTMCMCDLFKYKVSRCQGSLS